MKIESYRDLRLYQASIKAAMRIFEITKKFPSEEKCSMTDQMRRASRSVCSNIGEAWRRRRYKAAFIAKLNDSETEATETQVWLELSLLSDYISKDIYNEVFAEYESITAQLVVMINQPEKWIIKPKPDLEL
jgi:four helix bundle protein